MSPFHSACEFRFPPFEGETPRKIETLIFIAFVKNFFRIKNFLLSFFPVTTTTNEFVLSYIEWNADLMISRAGTKSAASAFLRYVHFERLRRLFRFIHVSRSVQLRPKSENNPRVDYKSVERKLWFCELARLCHIGGIRPRTIITFSSIRYCGATTDVAGRSRDWLTSVIACGKRKSALSEVKSCEISRRCESCVWKQEPRKR